MLLSFLGENDSQYTFLTFLLIDEGTGGMAGWIDASLCGGFSSWDCRFSRWFGGFKDVDVAG